MLFILRNSASLCNKCDIIIEVVMWYVKAEWNGFPNCWWGAYKNKETADKVAERVNGTVFHESEFNSLTNYGIMG